MLDDHTLDVFDLFGVEYEPAAPTTKACSKCGEDKPLSEYNRRKGGVRNDCKACQYERAQAWREANRTRINARAQAWREAHRAEAGEYAREYREKHREKIAATLKARKTGRAQG